MRQASVDEFVLWLLKPYFLFRFPTRELAKAAAHFIDSLMYKSELFTRILLATSKEGDRLPPAVLCLAAEEKSKEHGKEGERERDEITRI